MRTARSFPPSLSIVPIQLEDRLVYTIYLHDITKRKEAEREIQSLARIAGESPDPILRVNPTGLVVYANNASSPLLEAWSTSDGGFLPDAWVEEVGEALDGGHYREHETETGEQVYSLLFAPIRELSYVNIYARDITAVRRAEQESRQHQAELVHVCRLSTMGEVATGMAHELNQPLSAIVNFASGCSRRLQGNVGRRQELVDAMGQITTQAQRASEIIRRLRALVGKQPPIRSLVDLNYLVREVCTFVEYDTGKMDVAIDLDLAPGEIPVDVDLVQIEQVLLNLVRNALDALQEIAPEKRRLTVRTLLKGRKRRSWSRTPALESSLSARSRCSSPSTRPRSPAWVWGCRSARRFWRTTGGGFGRSRTRKVGPYFSFGYPWRDPPSSSSRRWVDQTRLTCGVVVRGYIVRLCVCCHSLKTGEDPVQSGM